MWNTEEDFPRGGKAQSKPITALHANEHDDFTEAKSIKFIDSSKRNDKNSNKMSRKRKAEPTEAVERPKRVKLEVPGMLQTPLHQLLCQDMVVLATVCHAHRYNVSLSLPGGLKAHLPITNISAAYTSLLKALTDSTEGETEEEIKPADELFLPGMLVAVKINEILEVNNQKKITVSAVPSEVNKTLTAKAICDGMLLFGSVCSVEDHGYSLDIGVKDIKAFLPRSEAKDYIANKANGEDLCIGQPLWCVVNSGTTNLSKELRVITLSICPKKIKEAKMKENIKMMSITAGAVVDVIVSKVYRTGLVVKLGSFMCTIHRSNLNKSIMDYSSGQQLKTKVLFVEPGNKDIELTELPKLVNSDGGAINMFRNYKTGDICEAKVQRTEKKTGVYFQLQNGVKALCLVANLNDSPELRSLDNFVKGSLHKCRIVNFNFMETIAIVSLKESTLKEQFLKISEIHPGDIIKGVIKTVKQDGVLVKLSRTIFSFVGNLHLSDVPVKQPLNKFKVGQKVKCRVLKVDLGKSKVFLTLKKSLVKSKLPVVTDYEQLSKNIELDGFIYGIGSLGARVAFYNDVVGYVSLKEMSTEKIEDPQSLFYKGQVVRCKVIYYQVDEKKLVLSFNLGDRKKEPKEKNESALVSDFSIGQMVRFYIVRHESQQFRVQVLKPECQAILPFHGLSDFREIQELRKRAFKPGDSFEGIVFSNKQLLILSMKESLLSAPKTSFVSDVSELKTGSLMPGEIINHQKFGIFIKLPGDHRGLCLSRELSYLQPSHLTDLFLPGQTVITRIGRIDTKKKRFLGSLGLQTCYEGGYDDGVKLVSNYLEGKAALVEKLLLEDENLYPYKDMRVGKIVEISILSTHKKGALCVLQSGAKGLVTTKHYGELNPEAGENHKAVVLFVDLETPCIELSIDPEVVASVSRHKETKSSALKVNQELKANILLVKPEFVLMMPRGHARGKLVYLPAKKHLNDVDVIKPFKVGTFTDIAIAKADCNDSIIAILRDQKGDTERQNGIKEDGKISLVTKPGKHDYTPGRKITVRVKSILPLQANVLINGTHGRIHVSEVSDDVKDDVNPLNVLSVGKRVNVRIIGLRDLATQSYLPISRPKNNKTILECSMKPSKLGVETTISSPLEEPKPSKGDRIRCFVGRVDSDKLLLLASCAHMGYVEMLHVSENVNVLNNVKSFFKIGRCVTAYVLNPHQTPMKLSLIENNEMKVKSTLNGLVTSVEPGKGIMINLPEGHRGIVPCQSTERNCVDEFVKCVIQSVPENGRILLSLVNDSGVKPIILKRKRQLSDSNSNTTDSDKKIKLNGKATENTRLHVEGFSWTGDLPEDLLHEDKRDSGHETDNSENEEKSTKAGKPVKRRKRTEEKLIQEYEKNQVEGKTELHNADEFEKLVLQSPNSSVVWLRYMAYHAQLGEMEKARAVAERALNTINFREEQEKKNVWLAYLNLETNYGHPDDVKKLLQRAVSYNDPLDISLKMCDIYVSANKSEEAEYLFNTIIRKHKHSPEGWKAYAQFLYQASRLQSARALLQRCISVLDKKHHVEVINRFANLEFFHGESERGRTMFDNLIASYPSRTDLWSIYVDMLTKHGDIEGARLLLERAVKQKLNKKKMNYLIQKFIKFEKTYGTEDRVEAVKQINLEVITE